MSFVTVKTFSRPLDAQLALARLDAEGIDALIPDEQVATIDPLVLDALGGVRLQVRVADLERATAVLSMPLEDPVDDELEPGPRCPRCDSVYVSPEWTGMQLLLAVPLLGLPLSFMKKPLHCKKCEHVFPAPELDPDRPPPSSPFRMKPPPARRQGRPIFRLRRSHAGLGGFAGLVVGVLLGLVLGGAAATAAVILLPLAGWAIGHALGHDVCSDPQCRAPLPGGERACAGCTGKIEGRIDRAAEHSSAKAEWHKTPEPALPAARSRRR